MTRADTPHPPALAPLGGFGLYVHWPFCLSKCPYCDFNSHVRGAVDESVWQAALLRELDTLAGRIESATTLTSIFFGGGTPSLMPPAIAAAVIERAAELFPFADDIEITLEANPTSSEAGRFAAFREAGINRLSLGVQSLKDEDLRFLGRQHTAHEALAALDLARRTFPRLSFDLIYARPGQSAAEWQQELSRALGFAADHLSLYQLTIEPETKFGALAAAGQFRPLTDDVAADLFDLTQDITRSAGLPAYEISNHALPGAESRHNLVYWRGGAWIGIGPGAHGRLPFAKDRRIATETEKLPEKWLALVGETGAGLTLEAPVAPRDQALEVLLMGLRLAEGVGLARVRALAPDLIDQARLEALVEDGFLVHDGERLALTAKGRLLLNRLLEEMVATTAD
jgi:putative oxygen-independent coproporphyrinogen III oxidase